MHGLQMSRRISVRASWCARAKVQLFYLQLRQQLWSQTSAATQEVGCFYSLQDMQGPCLQPLLTVRHTLSHTRTKTDAADRQACCCYSRAALAVPGCPGPARVSPSSLLLSLPLLCQSAAAASLMPAWPPLRRAPPCSSSSAGLNLRARCALCDSMRRGKRTGAGVGTRHMWQRASST